MEKVSTGQTTESSGEGTGANALTEQEKVAQEALGTRPREIFASGDWKHVDELLTDLKKGLENLGLYMYWDPMLLDGVTYGVVVSELPLTNRQIAEKTMAYYKDVGWYDEDDDDECTDEDRINDLIKELEDYTPL